MTTAYEHNLEVRKSLEKAMSDIRKPFEKLGAPFVDGVDEKPKKDLSLDGSGSVGEMPKGGAPFVDGVEEKPKKDYSLNGSGSVGEMPEGKAPFVDGTKEKPKKDYSV